MKKKIFSILFTLVLMLSFSLIPSVPAAAATIRVVPGPGTPIQNAINAASAGDVIFVGAGTYTENVVVNKSVSIKGAGAKTTTVQGSGNNTVFSVTASDVSITGFTIRGADNVWQSGILVSGADNVRIVNNVVERNAYGVFLSDSNAASIVNNVIRYNDAPRAASSSRIDNGTGIIAWHSGGGTYLNTLIKANDIYYNYKFGIYVGGGAAVNADGTEINGNKLYRNGAYWNIGAGDWNWLGMGFQNAMGTISVGGNNVFPTASGDYWVSNSPGLVLDGTPSYTGIPVPPAP